MVTRAWLRSALALPILASAWACVPPTTSVGEVDDSGTSDDGTSSTSSTHADSSSTSDGSANEEGASTADLPSTDETSTSSIDDGASTTSAMPSELPPDAAGEWLCIGWEDPIYLRIEPGDTLPWGGTACGPSIAIAEPSEWTNCDELGDHLNVTNTQAYWTFELAYEDDGGPEASLDLGVDYVPETDVLEGFLMPNAAPEFLPTTCTRQAN